MAKGRLALVTGASGFLGLELSRALLSARWRVRGSVRATHRPVADGVDPFVLADLADADAVRSAVTGVDAVVHCAGLAHVLDRSAARNDETFRRINVRGTQTVFDAAAECGVRLFVFLSSVAAVSEGGPEPIAETTPPVPRTAYGRSKLEAEQVITARASTAELRTTILRPAMVYGPGMKGNPLRLFRLVQQGVPLPVASVRNLRSVLYSGNLAAAVIASLDRAGARIETFLTADDEPVSTPDLIRMIAAALGRPARMASIPPDWLRAVARAADGVAGGIRGLEQVEKLVGSAVVKPTRLNELTGFRSPCSTREGLERTARWYRSALAASATAQVR
ncbi:MAG: NAD-dependent epimerase/dehydratase family protein [Longimicrobiales bacterium]